MFGQRIKAACFAVLICIVSPTQATTFSELELGDAARMSSAIITAEVKNEVTVTEDGQVFTHITLSVIEQIKGGTPGTITLKVPGGTYHTGKIRVSEIVPGITRSITDSNERSLYFLTQDSSSGTYSMIGFNQGKLDLRSENGIDVVQGTLTDGNVMTLTDMKIRLAEMEEN